MEIGQDLRYALRTLTRSPGFAATAVLVLALAVGVNIAIFSLVNAVLLRPLPARAPGELVYIYPQANSGVQPEGLSSRDYAYLEKNNDVFSGLAGFGRVSAKIRTSDGRAPARGERVSGNYFDVLGVGPMLGRTLRVGDDERAATPVVVIGEGLWRDRFHADETILGKQIALDDPFTSAQGRSYTVVGVVGGAFKGTQGPWEATAYWIPTSQQGVDYEVWCQPNPTSVSLQLIGRLTPGVTIAQARAAIVAMAPRLPEWSLWGGVGREGAASKWFLVVASSQRARLPFGVRGVVPDRLAAALLVVSAILLLIAVSNLTGVLMARGVTRRGEIAIRLMLGASRWRVARQLLVEGVMLSSVSGVFGLAFARICVGVLLAWMPAQIGIRARDVALDVPVDLHVLLFTAVVCLGAGVLVALAPARQASKTNLRGVASADGVATSRESRAMLKYWIVVPQICLSLVLLIVAGVLVKTLLRAELTDPGYEPARLVFVDFERAWPACQPWSSESGIVMRDEQRAIERRLLERATATGSEFSGVSLAGLLNLPFDNGNRAAVITKDALSRGGQSRWVSGVSVSPGYFSTLGIPLLRGRDFDAHDTADAPLVVIVSPALANLLWPGRDPLGESLALHDTADPHSYPPSWAEVIAVAGEVKPALFDGESNPTVYTSLAQRGAGQTLVARARGRSADAIRELQESLRQADGTANVLRSTTVPDAIAELRYPRRTTATILAASGLIGLVLASLGLYGVVSYSVARRVRELGIRAALGAQEGDIIRLVLVDGVRVLLVGTLLGLALALAAVRIVSATVVALPAIDLGTLMGVPLFLAAVVLLACYVPARRAARIDPMVALREF